MARLQKTSRRRRSDRTSLCESRVFSCRVKPADSVSAGSTASWLRRWRRRRTRGSRRRKPLRRTPPWERRSSTSAAVCRSVGGGAMNAGVCDDACVHVHGNVYFDVCVDVCQCLQCCLLKFTVMFVFKLTFICFFCILC